MTAFREFRFELEDLERNIAKRNTQDGKLFLRTEPNLHPVQNIFRKKLVAPFTAPSPEAAAE